MKEHWVSILTAFIAAVATVVSAIATDRADKAEQNTVGPIAEGQKLCSAVSTGNWRDSIIVPKSWKVQNCKAYKDALTPSGEFQLGCVYDEVTVLGEKNSPIPPARNCGW